MPGQSPGFYFQENAYFCRNIVPERGDDNMGHISIEKVIYAILKRYEKAMENDEQNIDFSKEIGPGFFDISKKQWTNIFLDIQKAGYIEGIHEIEDGNKDYNIIHINQAKITLLGRKYLKDNSSFAKTYNIAKELRDWVKLGS